MKHKHILLTTSVAIFLSGCGQNANENDDYTFYSKLKDVNSESSRTTIQNKINKHLFTDLKEKKNMDRGGKAQKVYYLIRPKI